MQGSISSKRGVFVERLVGGAFRCCALLGQPPSVGVLQFTAVYLKIGFASVYVPSFYHSLFYTDDIRFSRLRTTFNWPRNSFCVDTRDRLLTFPTELRREYDRGGGEQPGVIVMIVMIGA